MGEEKKEEAIKELEKELRDFQKQWGKQWEKFLTNDFQHLVEKVDNLTTNIGGIIKQNNATQRKLGTLEKNLLIVLKNTTIDLGK